MLSPRFFQSSSQKVPDAWGEQGGGRGSCCVQHTLLCAVESWSVFLGSQKLAWNQAPAQGGVRVAESPEEVEKPSSSHSPSHE